MGLRDRFFTPATAKAILSWRLAVGVAVGIVSALVGLPVIASIGVGLAVYAGTVATAMPKTGAKVSLDPFTLSEPWRQFVQSAQRSRRQLTETVRSAREGPLRERLQSIADRLDGGVVESWEIAKRGDEIDGIVTGLDPTRLRSRLDTLRSQSTSAPTENLAAAVASVESQIASADRLKAISAQTADRLRLTQARLDELVARAAEVAAGTTDTDTYATQVDDLITELEAMHLAVQELPQ